MSKYPNPRYVFEVAWAEDMSGLITALADLDDMPLAALIDTVQIIDELAQAELERRHGPPGPPRVSPALAARFI